MTAIDRSRTREPLTARAARWSATHRRAPCSAGSRSSSSPCDRQRRGHGPTLGRGLERRVRPPTGCWPSSSRRRAAEQVLIQSRDADSGAEYRAVVTELVGAALQAPCRADISRRSRPPTPVRCRRTVARRWSLPDHRRPRHGAGAGRARAGGDGGGAAAPPGSCGSARSATRAPTRRSATRIGDDFQRAEITSLPVTLVILVFAFGALVAAGMPLLLG